MKTLAYCAAIILLIMGCTPGLKKEHPLLRDGFYEVIKADTSLKVLEDSIHTGQVILSVDTCFSPGDLSKVLTDTTDFVALDIETAPVTEDQAENKKSLSITLSPEMAEKMRVFSARRVMKQVAIVLDGKVITMHKIREAITGNKLQITRCDDNGCAYLYSKIKTKMRK